MLALGPAPEATAEDRPPLEITYVANDGFLLRAGQRAVLIDALFGGRPLDFCDVPDQETRRRLEATSPPFDQVDVALVTHRHIDHFEPTLATRFLKARPQAVLVGPRQVVAALREQPDFASVAGQVREVTPKLGSSETLEIGEIGVRALRLRHSPYMVTDEKTGRQYNRHQDVENVGYVVRLGGHALLHIGDGVLYPGDEHCRFDLDSERLDLAFVGDLLWEPTAQRAATIRRCLKPGRVVVMHLDPDQRRDIDALVRSVSEGLPEILVPGRPGTRLALLD